MWLTCSFRIRSTTSFKVGLVYSTKCLNQYKKSSSTIRLDFEHLYIESGGPPLSKTNVSLIRGKMNKPGINWPVALIHQHTVTFLLLSQLVEAPTSFVLWGRVFSWLMDSHYTWFVDIENSIRRFGMFFKWVNLNQVLQNNWISVGFKQWSTSYCWLQQLEHWLLDYFLGNHKTKSLLVSSFSLLTGCLILFFVSAYW